MRSRHSLTYLLVALTTLVVLLLVAPGGRAASQTPPGALKSIWDRAREAGAYTFTADVEQTLIPRPLPSMIGQSDERVALRVEGEVTLPHEARMELRFEGDTLDLPPLVLLRDGADTYLIKDGERVPVGSPTELAAPTSDYLGYLVAAENIQPCGDGDSGAVIDGATTCHAFDVNGPRYAEYVRRQMEAEFKERGEPLPPGAELSPSPLLQRTAGHGRVWADTDGLPLRQVVDLQMPSLTDHYDGQLHLVVDFEFGEAARERVAAASSSLEEAEALRGLTGRLPLALDLLPRPAPLGLALTDLYCLLYVGIIAGVMLLARRRRWLHALIAIVISIILLVSPLLQMVGIVRFHTRRAHAASAASLAEVIGLPADPGDALLSDAANQQIGDSSAPSPSPMVSEPRLALQSTSDSYCGKGSTDEDADNDGLTDAAEYCLGTDPYYYDSDRDLITDTVEIDGLWCGDRDWPSNPFKVDSNDDGLIDYFEWPQPIGGAPRLEDVDEDCDIDGDGVPNLWDDDNDGDGVPDSLDLSPFSRTAFSDTFSLTTQGGGFDGYQYIEIQVQPQNMDQLRYGSVYLDWPYDDLGQIQDLDDSTDDIRLTPMLRIRANQAPDRNLALKYGVTVFDEDDGSHTLYAALSPAGDGGQVVAFYAKAAYSPDRIDDIRWEKVELVWMVELTNDQERGGRIVTSVTPIGVQAVPFRVTGLQITKSRNFESAILGTPETAAEDRNLFNLVFGLSNTFLTYQEPDLQDIAHRFSSPNTPITETWGVPAQRVTVDLPGNPYGHVDEGIADLSTRVRNYLDTNNYPTDANASLVIAYQEEVGMYGLEDWGRFEASNNLNLNLSHVAMSTRRGLKVHTYAHEAGAWESMSLADTLAVMEQRYHDELTDILADLQHDYPDLTEDDLELLLSMFYTSWYVGETRIISVDGQAVAPNGRDDQDVHDEFSQDRDALPAYLLEATRLGEPGGGLRIGDNQAQMWEYLRQQEGNETGFLEEGAGKMGLTVVVNLARLRSAYKTVKGVQWALMVAGTTGNWFRFAKPGGSFFLGLTVSLGFTWLSFVGTAGAAGWDTGSPVFKAALVYAIVATIITVALFVIALCPAGMLLVGLLTFMDWIFLGVSLGELSLTGLFIQAIADLIYKFKVLTEFEDVDFVAFDTAVMDEELGIVVGNRFRVSDECVGTIRRTSDGERKDLEDSWVTCRFAGSATGATTVNKNGTSSCSISGRTLTCRDPVAVEYQLDTAQRNVQLTVKSSVSTKTFNEECWFGICDREPTYTYLPSDLPESARWEPMDFYLDVLPANLLDMWDWDEIINPDGDGDGLTDDEEISLGTHPDNWDSDGDGLSDKFEFDHQDSLGTDPTKYDTDGDGLSDGLEYRIGTKIDARDSDGDGLTDGEEVFHQNAGGEWVGGWLISLPGREEPVRVFSDPLIADADGDGLNDRSERSLGTSPYAFNDSPHLTLRARPWAESPGGATGMYVAPGDEIEVQLSLDNVGPSPVTSTLTLCLPSFLTNVQGGDMQGDRTPGKETNPSGCEDQGFAWSFAGDGALRHGEAVSTTLTADVHNLSASASGEISATLPYRMGAEAEENDIIDQAPVIVDVDDPKVIISAPADGALLGGGISHYVIGGSARDETSWVTGVEAELAGEDWVEAEGISPWAHTWELPDDGQYTLQARARDYMGRVGVSPAVTVTVDNTAPAVTLDLADGQVVSGESGSVITITLSGDARDNLSGLARVQVSTDGRPWREVWAEAGAPVTVTWSTEWTLPNEESAQGQHTVAVRAFDRAGNRSDALRRTIIVDVVPPTSELTDRTYLLDPPPHVPANQPLDLYGVANDAGRVPEPARPVELVGQLDGLDDATIWLELSSVTDDDGGVSVAWIGDFNGDRLSDLFIGLPAAEGGNGQVTVVYGRPGGWSTPSDTELLADSLTSFVGQKGAAIGDRVVPAGDVNGDGFDDLLVGDAENNRVYVIFGQPGALGRDLVLDGPRYPYWSVIDLTGLGDLSGLAPAGDVNGDGFDDLLISTSGAEGNAYLLLGGPDPWWEIVPLDVRAAAMIGPAADGASLSGVGDMDGDQHDEFVIVSGNTVYLLGGRDTFAAGRGEPNETLTLGDDAIATFASSEGSPEIAALGDVNGDGLADFIYADGDEPKLVFGDVNRDWHTQALAFTPAASGFLAAPGDVDADGLNDILVGTAEGHAYLVLGKDLYDVRATLTDVRAAASAPYAAGADLNSDGSSDLLLVPGALGVGMSRAPDYGKPPHVDPRDLPAVRLPVASTSLLLPSASWRRLDAVGLWMQATTHTVDDDGGADYTTIQAAVDAAGDGDTISVKPGVYPSFNVDSNDNLTISGVHPDAVFVDGDGGQFAVKIQNADGVRLEKLTLRNAGAAVHLEQAGVGGYITTTLKTVLDTLLIYDVSNAVTMDRVSTLRLTRSTLAGSGNHIDLRGDPDPAMEANWSTVLTDARATTSERGAIFGDGAKIYFVDDSAQLNIYDPEDDTWDVLSAPPRGFNAGMTVDENGPLWALRGDEFGGFDGPVHAIAYVSDDEIYVGGDFHRVGDVAVDYVARWDGSGWGTVGTGGASPDGVVYAVDVYGNRLYAGGTFGLRYLPDRTGASAWQDWGAITGGGAVYAIAPYSDDVYVGGSFTKIGGVSANRIAKREVTGDWKLLGHDANSSCNGALRGSHVSALVIKGSHLYFGGQFATVAATPSMPGGACSTGCSANLARLRLSDDVFEHVTDCDNMLDNREHVYAIGFSGDDLVVGGAFSCVDMEHGPGWSRCDQEADNLAILRPNGSWVLPDYLKSNGPVRALRVDGDSLYLGGDFTQVGGSTGAQRVAYYDTFPNAGGAWHTLDEGVDDSVRELIRSGGNTYVGGAFTEAGGDAAFGLARWDGSRWTSQAFYEHDGSTWQSRSDPAALLGAGAVIASDGDGILYAVPGGSTSDFYRYTVSSDTWTQRASLPERVGVGAALAWADDHLYALRGGGHSDFYRYSPTRNTWEALEPVTQTIVVDAGGAMAWDGRNWLYILAGGNGRQLLRYRIPDGKWEVMHDTPSAVNAGAGLVRVGQNLYGVPGCTVAGCSEALWSYDPVAIYLEKLTLDRVALVAPEAVPAVDWINLDSVVIPPDDFVVGGSGSAWVGGAGITWSPEPQLDGGTRLTHGEARFRDPDRDIYRLDSGSLVDGGYHAYRPDAVVGNGEAFTSIQAAIDSGANRVELRPGTYRETFYLVSGVEVTGNGADLTIVETPADNAQPALARAEGVVGAKLSMLTLNGGDRGVDGLLVEDGARYVTLARTVIRGAATAISTTGSTTELEVVNNTVVSNTNGLVAADCAPVDVRNTIFAHHSDTGLAYEECATRKLHKYNLFWANATDLAPGSPGPGELFLDPLFVSPGPPSHDYHTQDGSPVIDAGDPGDPPPPGGGGRVDIGYIEQNRAALYVDDDYCETCSNDGLSWQVDAFDIIQAALDKAADNIRHLKGPRYTVGVGAGTYTETVTIPSYVRLIGSGAEETIIDAHTISKTVVTFDGVVASEINGFTVRAYPNTTAISVTGASNSVLITRNIIETWNQTSDASAVAFSGRATGQVAFNTLVSRVHYRDHDTPEGQRDSGVSSAGPGTWVAVENNVFTGPRRQQGQGCDDFHEGHFYGLHTLDGGQIFNGYNLLHNTAAYRDDDGTGLSEGPGDLRYVGPCFEFGTYRPEPASPAPDAASPYAEVPPGGGARADMGYYELTAMPVAVFLGREDVSSATGNSGLSQVEVGFSQVNDPNSAVTDTIPSTWMPVTLDTPEETVSYWQASYTPTHESLYRFYSRATDVAGNNEGHEQDWYEGVFVADSTPPVVIWTLPAAGAVVSTPVQLKAEVSDYDATGAFSVDDFWFEVGETKYDAEWAADPWDEEDTQPRAFRAWVELTDGPYEDVAAVAEDRAGNVMSDTLSFTVSGQAPADTIAPTLVVSSPVDGDWFTSTVVFSGTVTDAESGVASVEVSLDGGYTWQPATVDGEDWALIWEAPEDQAFVSYPAWVRARDQTGNTGEEARTFSVDNVPPRGPDVEDFTAVIGLLEKDAPPGTHFDTPVSLRTTWSQPLDGSGYAVSLIAVTQVTDTASVAMTDVQTATVYTATLNVPGDWYVHLAAQDRVGNRSTRRFGPWHVGTFADTDAVFTKRVQTIVADGQFDRERAMEEWHEFGGEWGVFDIIGTFVRSGPQGSWWSPQQLYTTWDGTYVYLGWAGAWWTLDGEMWAYLDLGDGGCSQPVGADIPACPTLPFEADHAINISSPVSGALWACDGVSWAEDTETEWDFVQGDGGFTEIQLAWLDLLDVDSWVDLDPSGGTTISDLSLGLIAFAVDDAGEPWAVFPTTNPMTDFCSESYSWAELYDPMKPSAVTLPNEDQPVGTRVSMTLDPLQAPAAAWCPGSQLDYVFDLHSREVVTTPGLTMEFDASPGLSLQSVQGAEYTGNWTSVDVPAIPPDAQHAVTVSAVLTDDVCNVAASSAVTLSAQLYATPPVTLELSHLVDCQPPTLTVATDPAQSLRPLLGTASDDGGSGVATVEYRIDGGEWQPASGTLFWSADVALPAATTWQVDVRATDRCGWEDEVTVQFSDSTSPTVTLDVMPMVAPGPVDVSGLTWDLPSGGEVTTVEVSIDDGDWQAASLGAPDTEGVHRWQFTWEPTSSSTTYTLRARATDAAGNIGQSEPSNVYVGSAPVADAGPDQTVSPGDLVMLDGSGSYDPDGEALSYGWAQTGGVGVTLSNASVVSPTFTAPGTVGLITFTLTVTDSLALTAVDITVVTVIIDAELAMAKTVAPSGPISPGEALTYTLSFTNTGPQAVTDVVITDHVPISVTQTHVVSSGVAITEIAPGYVWAVEDLSAGQGGTITITGVLSQSLPGGHVFTNTAVITATGAVDSANNSASVAVRVSDVRLEVNKEVSDHTPREGAGITYDITVTNQGDTSTVVVSDTLPSGVSYQSDDGGGAYDESTGAWMVGSLGNGERATLHITATVEAGTAGGLITNTAVISAPSPIQAGPDDCWDTAVIAPQHPRAVIVIVTPEAGGRLVYTDTQGLTTTVEVPAGAVTETLTLVFTPLDGPTHPTAPLLFAGHAFTLEAYHGPYLLPGYVFQEPIAVTVHYSDADVTGIDEASLALYRWTGGGWQDAACGRYEPHPEEKWLSVEICHLNEFALLGRPIHAPIGGATLVARLTEGLGLPAALAVAVMALVLAFAAAAVRHRE